MTFRLASGLFSEPDQLERAIAELNAAGSSKDDMCLAGTREALQEIREQAAVSARPLTSGLVDRHELCPLRPAFDGVEVVATSGTLLRELLEKGARSTGMNGKSESPSSWLLSELFGRFVEHMRRGAIMLLIGARDAARQQRGSRILLRHSAHTVQTHEFTPARRSDR